MFVKFITKNWVAIFCSLLFLGVVLQLDPIVNYVLNVLEKNPEVNELIFNTAFTSYN